MAQQVDPFAEFEEKPDPFAEFEEKPVTPIAAGPSLNPVVPESQVSLGSPDTSRLPAPPVVKETPEPPQNPLWRAIDWATSPLTDAPSRLANWASDKLAATNKPTGYSIIDTPTDLALRAQQGLLKGTGWLASQFTSPSDIAATALTGGANLALKAGARGAGMLTKAALAADSVPIVHGGSIAFNPMSNASLGERGAGLAEAALGAAGAASLMPDVLNPKVLDFPGRTPVAPTRNMPTPQESERALLDFKDYDSTKINQPDAPIDPMQSFVVEQNKVGAIRKLIGGPELTNSGGQTVRVMPTHNFVNTPNEKTGLAVAKAAQTRKPVPQTERITPNEPMGMPPPPIKTGNPEIDDVTWKDYLSISRAIQSAFDLSMPFRQGLGLIHTKGWWQAWPDMVRSVGKEEAYKSVIDSINARPNYVKGTNGKSFAEEAGLQLTTLGSLAKRNEEFGSRIAEQLPLGLGKGIRISNRAADAFMNKLRADNFDSLIEQATKAGYNPKTNMVLAKQIADYVNTASGRGGFKGKGEEVLSALNQTLFSPRLMASRLNMLNPVNYTMTNPMVRRQYMKSAIAMGLTWNGLAELGKLGGAEVVNDPKSSDFRQIKIGNTRLDPSGGLRPYITLASRLSELGQKQSDRERYTGKFGAREADTDILEFVEGKLAPNARFMGGPIIASDKFPHYVGDELVKMFTPIMIQDIIELVNEDPELAALAIPGGFGMGINSYPPGKQEEKRMTETIPGTEIPFFPKKYDLRFPRK